MGLRTEFSGEHMATAAREGNTELRDQIHAAVAELQAEGLAEELALRYLHGEYRWLHDVGRLGLVALVGERHRLHGADPHKALAVGCLIGTPIASSLVVGKQALLLLALGCTVVKDSSRVYAVGLAELMRRAQQANGTLYQLLPIFSITGVLTCLLAPAIAGLLGWVARNHGFQKRWWRGNSCAPRQPWMHQNTRGGT